ncbi:MAG: hypothetical protein A2W91_14080 [Bacteroidetes bacterium GWF2_38_335]|nr:MAG: hypothetical protein A2W91_14080 [Bacteroidetes bacterium GWF2_38_335]OFY77842.1 MAG: hypothetical protein A2281_15770 [Bacteroidetes bacterium RIFOXYA12_FULL_38_20]HBS87349.1 RNA polymerase [Bacteroidales bacterium]
MEKVYPDIHKDIIELSRKGDSRAQYELYRLYSKAMFNICFRMMNSREEAEDMLQEAFGEAFTRLSSFRYESSFGAWLKQITVNKCINELKRKKANLMAFEDMGMFDEAVEEKEEKDLTYEVNKVRAAMEKLSDGYRVIFSLYLLEGYDHTEISEIMGISESTSKTQYLRAKNKIREILSSEKI